MLEKLLQQIRHNHALEHATINMLGRRYPNVSVAGVSGPWGFTLYSDLPIEDVVAALNRAREALLAGDADLAYHKQCGTNLVVTATLTTAATLVGFGLPDRKKTVSHWVEKLPFAVLMNAIALIFAPRLATYIQRRLTTDPHIGNLAVTSVLANSGYGIRRIQIRTASE